MKWSDEWVNFFVVSFQTGMYSSRRMSTRSPVASWNDAQTYSNQRNGNGDSQVHSGQVRGNGDSHVHSGQVRGNGDSGASSYSGDVGEIISNANGSTIHIHMNCNSGGNDGAFCGGDRFNGGFPPAFVPTLPGIWPLPPLSYGNGYFPPGFVFGCPPGPVLLPPMTGQFGGAIPTGW
jgi:hypothetical protein